ncbi:DUF5916 domain-containing protein [Algibacter mikhailovii]|uniref:DUF5916 domain-containing protein n=1 Tax=Algibacter mikhailovii TaxID=425498 RepID=A0A918VCB1_9FLAO|nr:DUF5916 domain-containing protein [Algibacter mikhailovii]GGZ88819.1 hypothetical protein GCM10007028_28640 [Algibacter mikhailovii]
MLYNESFLYIGIKAYAPGKDYKAPSYERDYSISGADVINLMFDTYSDRANAFLFGINPFGVRREGLISNGGISGNLDLSWDTKWLGETVIHDDYSISEIRIPMSSFKYKEGVTQWKFNSMRSNTQSNTKSSWSKVPQNQDQLNLGYYAPMVFEKPLKKSKNPISIIPYITPSYIDNSIKDEETFEFKTGFDVKIPVKSSFMLDLTVSPDFSSEDVVPGQNNVTRFEIKQDETRQFFKDNGDLFNEFGLPDDALAFYSRRVGVGRDTNNNDVIVPITAGVKFTGKINNGLRIGVLDVQTKGDEDELIPKNNNLVLAVQQKIFSRSNVGFFLINRQVTNPEKEYSGTEYNRVVGSDLNFFSKDNSFDAQIFLHKSFTEGIESNAISTGTYLNLEKRRYTLRFTGQYVDEGFQSDLGYTRRKDIVRANPFSELNFYPENNSINTIILKLSNNLFWKPSDDMRFVHSDLLLAGTTNFTNGASLGLTGALRYEYLDEPFDPVGGGDGELLPIGGYNYHDVKLDFNTDKRKAFWFEGNTKYGTFYTGNKFTADVTFQYRFQPIFFVSLKMQYDDISLPEPYSSDELWYLGPTFNFTFTKSLFWNTDIQYSSQSETFFVVSRIQWRYAPLSDIFLTYSDSRATSPLDPIERGVFLKVTYWFDILTKKGK